MAFNIWDVGTLNRLLQDRPVPSSFLLDMFFPVTQPARDDVIFFDSVTTKRRLAPFVSPLREGQVVDMPGAATKSFRPAYVKDKRVFNSNLTVRRRPGETIGAPMSPSQRLEDAVQANMTDQLQMLVRREEWMASSALRLGQITVVGEGYPSQVVSFGRAGGHTVALTSTARWGESGVSPLANLKTWRSTAQTNGGGNLRDVIMDPLSAELFLADTTVQTELNRQAYRGQEASVNGLPISGYDENAEADIVMLGEFGQFRFWQYQTTYHDENGTEQKMLPDYTVLMASRGRLEGERVYGFVKDEEANFTTDRYFVKSWIQPDPAVRFMLLQSAPLVVPFRPNASFCATVR
jgi:hypothetical protein